MQADLYMIKETEKLEKMDKTINYDKFSTTDKNGREVVGFGEYMGLDLFARTIFDGIISLKKDRRKSGKSIGERLKVRKQKFNELNEVIVENNRIKDKIYLEDILSMTV